MGAPAVSGADELVTISEDDPNVGDAARAPPLSSAEVKPAPQPDTSSRPPESTTPKHGLARFEGRVMDALGQAFTGITRLVRLLTIGSLWHGVQSLVTRVIDGQLRVLQRLRGGVKNPDPDDAGKEETRREGGREQIAKAIRGRAQEVLAAPAMAPTRRLRVTLIVLLFTVIGCISGMLFSFALFSNMVTRQAMRIDDQLDEIVLLGRQYEKAKTTIAQLRNSNQTQLRRLEDAEQALARLNALRPAEEAVSAEARRNDERSARAAIGTTDGRTEARANRECVVGTDDIGGSLSKCIRKLNGH